MTDFTVRQLTPKDVDAFTMMAKQFFKETIYGQQFSVDMTKVKDVIRQHSQSDKQVGWLIEIEGQIIGGLLTAAGETFFGRDLVCKEIAVFILPEYRGQGLMSQLVRAYTQWAKTIGARHIRLDITSGVHTESTAKKLQHLGFSRLGYVYIKDMEV